MDGLAIGLDTSCYTTSVACAAQQGIVFEQRTMLSVVMGERGLRQSDGVFQHVRNLPALTDALLQSVDPALVRAVAVSAKPTDDEASYMPVFLAGRTVAAAIAGALRVPLILTTHQRGHIRAALIGNEGLLQKERFLALHLSGGTTDVLLVTAAAGRIQSIVRVGGSDDLHAGQFVDRAGVSLGLAFPCGKGLEGLAAGAQDRTCRIPSSVRGLVCSLSGAETQAQRLIAAGTPRETVAFAVYDCLARTVGKLIDRALTETQTDAALLCGGVSSSALLKTLLNARTNAALFWGEPRFSADNAAGVALFGGEAVWSR